METLLLEQLKAYAKSDYYPFHMPGHKRNECIKYIPAAIDITEIEGFDNLHHAQSVLLQAQQRAAQLYHADESFFLVNGSTSGILAAISSCVSSEGTLVLARNSHKAAYHAAFLRNLKVHYIYPRIIEEYGINGGVNPAEIEKSFVDNPNMEAVFITSPTYEGMVSNIREIADITHKNGAVLIVDEAHGAHFGLGGQYFPLSAVTQGADIVIQSMHKTLPSMTQTAILHVNDTRVDRRRLKKYLQIYQTSSPSYVFMAGMDSCIALIKEHGKQLFQAYENSLKHFYKEVKKLKKLHVLNPTEVNDKKDISCMDSSKICVFTNGTISGNELYEILLERYHLQMEMAAGEYVLAMTSVMDKEEGYRRFLQALYEIDEELSCCNEKKVLVPNLPKAEIVMRAGEAEHQVGERIALEESEGKISLEYRYVYPPGVPVLVPGERITKDVLEVLAYYKKRGLNILGYETEPDKIEVVKDL